MAKQLTEEELKAEVSLYETLISIMPEERQKSIGRMMETLGDKFFTAPASSREEFHSCYAGGLLVHSLNVVKALRRITKALCHPGRYLDETLAFVGLFHDLGKVGDGSNDYYIPETSDWHREKLGQLYKINEECTHMTIPERGIYLLQKNGIELSREEFLALRLSDGQNVRENEPYRYKEPDLALLVHWANTWAERKEKESSKM